MDQSITEKVKKLYNDGKMTPSELEAFHRLGEAARRASELIDSGKDLTRLDRRDLASLERRINNFFNHFK